MTPPGRQLNLSKSTLIRSLQCQKSLWLYKYRYKDRDPISPEQQAVFRRGHDFGRLAQDLFPGGVDVSPPHPRLFRQSLQATQLLVRSETPPPIYEAAFRHQAVLVYVDILVLQNNEWQAYEVKSSRRISETHIRDAAIQYHVLTRAGIDLQEFFLVHVREDFDAEMHREAGAVFTMTPMIDQLRSLQPFIEETIECARETLSSEQMPDIVPGKQCNRPYPCDFKGFCNAV